MPYATKMIGNSDFVRSLKLRKRKQLSRILMFAPENITEHGLLSSAKYNVGTHKRARLVNYSDENKDDRQSGSFVLPAATNASIQRQDSLPNLVPVHHLANLSIAHYSA